jgi:hypothetical protein
MVGLFSYKEAYVETPSTGRGVDKETFLQYFPLNGLLGERLFAQFDTKKSGYIDFDGFITGLAKVCRFACSHMFIFPPSFFVNVLTALSRGTLDDKIHFLFDMYDVSHDQTVSKAELSTLLNHIPKEAFLQYNNYNYNQSHGSVNCRCCLCLPYFVLCVILLRRYLAGTPLAVHSPVFNTNALPQHLHHHQPQMPHNRSVGSLHDNSPDLCVSFCSLRYAIIYTLSREDSSTCSGNESDDNHSHAQAAADPGG